MNVHSNSPADNCSKLELLLLLAFDHSNSRSTAAQGGAGAGVAHHGMRLASGPFAWFQYQAKTQPWRHAMQFVGFLPMPHGSSSRSTSCGQPHTS